MSKSHAKETSGRGPSASQEFGVATAPDTVRLERRLPGPVERIWAYLTDSELRGKWLATGAMEPRVGGRVELHFEHARLSEVIESVPAKYAGQEVSDVAGRVVRWEPPRVLAYTWGESHGGESEVTFELTPLGDEVQLVVTHRRLANRDQMTSVAAGWHAHLGILIDHRAGRPPKGFWETHTHLEAEYDRRLP
jgi:uncharacterized protein YndB with AHSA1/START domain